jgi:hypothetical protein
MQTMSSSRSGQAVSFAFYTSLLLVTAGSVAFSLDWTSAPLPPMPETEASVQAATLAAHVPPPGAFRAVAQVRSVYPARPLPPGSAPTVTAMAEPQVAQPAPTAPIAVAAPAQPKCDIAACSAAYHSFRAIDCSWQPFDGPRRFCDKGVPQQTEASAVPGAVASSIVAPEPDAAQSPPNCHVEACKQAFFTFNAADCTYQPSNGPRKVCAK